jgi:hypothetical protein
MRDDLEDSYGAIDWARTHLPPLQQAFETWLNAPPYLMVEEPRPEMGKKLFKLEINRRLPPKLNAGVGAIVNSIRSSLDLLAASLARRKGITPSSDHHFPIYACHPDFLDPLAEAKRKKWLRDIDRVVIEGLKPYAGGHDLLYVLHQMDITRKHERLIRVDLVPSAVFISPDAFAEGFEMPQVWPGFEDGAVIGWTNINATKSEFRMTAEIAFNEAAFFPGKPVIPTLRQFAGAAESIIQLFEHT